MELALPAQARVHTSVPKSKFFEKAKVNTKQKRAFTDKVQKIWWEYKLAPETIGIPATEKVQEVQVFVLELKGRTIPKEVLRTIDRSIPYPILYVLTYSTSTAYATSLKGAGEERYYISEWNADLRFRFTGSTMEALYQGIVKAFIGERVSAPKDFSALVEADKKRQALEREISALKNKIKSEKQFNRKVALNQQLHAVQAQLQGIRSK